MLPLFFGYTMRHTAKIEELRKQIEKLEEEERIELELLSSMTEEQRLAVELHNTLCTHNHIDACGWEYEVSNGKHDWANGGAHSRWLGKATKMVHLCKNHNIDIDVACKIIKIANKL